MRLEKKTRPRDRQCHGKNGFGLKKLAKRAIRRMRGRVGDLCVYRCPHCDRFHIGHNYAPERNVG